MQPKLVVGYSLFPYFVKFAIVCVVKLIDLTYGFTLTPSLHSRQDLPLKSQVLQVHSCSKWYLVWRKCVPFTVFSLWLVTLFHLETSRTASTKLKPRLN